MDFPQGSRQLRLPLAASMHGTDSSNSNKNIHDNGIRIDDICNSPPPFPLGSLPDELLFEVFSHLPQRDRLSVALIDKRCHGVATKLLYRRIYLNDSNVVRSDFMNIAINWTLLHIPSFLTEEESRDIANLKLTQLIETFAANAETLQAVQWIRINWDLDAALQKTILRMLCDAGLSLQRLENVTDPSCNDIIASGKISRRSLASLDMAPPNSLPELTVAPEYIPNLVSYLSQRISSHLSHMTLFIDPLKLFNYLYQLREKLTIVDLKLHWRREFYPPQYFTPQRCRSPPFKRLSEVFDVRTLRTLTIISWNESLIEREVDMLREFREFTSLEDLSLISIKQDPSILIALFSRLVNLRRLKMDFLEDYIPETTDPQIFLAILLNCKQLEFIDIRFEGIDCPMINLKGDKFEISQKCYCNTCNYTVNEILRKKIFLFPIDYYLSNIQDITAKDVFKMMRYLSLLPYSKACDSYPSVRTQPMNLDAFVKRMNENMIVYRENRNQLIDVDRNKIVNVRDARIAAANDSRGIDTEGDISMDGDEINIELDIDNILGQQQEQSGPSRTQTPVLPNNARFGDGNAATMADIPTGGIGNDNTVPTQLPQPSQQSVAEMAIYRENLLKLPHKPLTKHDVIMLYHALIHHFKTTYYTFLKGFPRLRFLMLNDIPTITIEEDGERIFHPVFYHFDYVSNLNGWEKRDNMNKSAKNGETDTVTKRATVI